MERNSTFRREKRYRGKMTIPEVADAMEMTVAQVRSTEKRALHKLLKGLQNDDVLVGYSMRHLSIDMKKIELLDRRYKPEPPRQLWLPFRDEKQEVNQ